LIRDIADRASERARRAGRKTVLDRDVKPAGGG
jgi:histone H3/H4